MTLPRLLVVVDGADDDGGRLALLQALADRPEVERRVLAWTSGPLVGELAALGPVVDAGQVNHWAPARLLARVGLRPVGQALKNRRLRRLLRDLGRVDGVLLVGGAVLPARAWLPGAPWAVLLDAGDVRSGRLPASGVGDGHVVATDAVAAEAVEALALPEDRRHVHGLLRGELPSGPPDRIGLAGWDAPAVGRIAATLPTADDGPRLSWFVREQEGWALWQGPDASPFAGRVDVVDPDAAADDVGRLTVLVEGRPDPGPVGPAAGLLGVPVVRCGPQGIDDAVTAAAAAWTRGPGIGTTATVTDTVAALLRLLAGVVS
mgnify:CR=1 FL=1